MKKIFLFIPVLIISTLCFSQDKFGSASFTSNYMSADGEKTIVYVSKVINLSKLDCSDINPQGLYAKKTTLDTYYECIIEWYKKQLINDEFNSLARELALKNKMGWSASVFNKKGGYNPNCVSQNEDACFFTKEEAEVDRLEIIRMYKSLKQEVVEL